MTITSCAETRDRTLQIRKVLIITLLLNIVVSLSKVFYGYMIHSVAITADGYHSMFDGVSNIVGLIGMHFASRPADEDHPYGHRKYETLFTIFIGVMMFITCLEIFKKVYESFALRQEVVATAQSFILMAVTMAVNIFVTTYERRMGKKHNSEFLIADAKHTASDIYATSGVIVGLVFIRLGFPAADGIVGIVVGLLVARAGIGILKEASDVLTDRTQMDVALIREIVCSIDNIDACHKIRARGTNSNIFLDLHIQVNPSLDVATAHVLAHKAAEKVKQQIKGIVDVLVHIEPSRTVHDGRNPT